MTRVAAIDCGTNSVRLLIADIGEELRDVERETRIVRLGQGVDQTGELAPEALEGACIADVWLGGSAESGEEPPLPLFGMAFDAFTLLFDAIREAGGDPRAVRRAMESMGERRGAAGAERLLPDGRIRVELEILELRGGRVVRAPRP